MNKNVARAAIVGLSIVLLIFGWARQRNAATHSGAVRAPSKWSATFDPANVTLSFRGAAGAVDANGDLWMWGGASSVGINPATFSVLRTSRSTADLQIESRRCIGIPPQGALYPSMAIDLKRSDLYVFGGWPASGTAPTDELYRVGLTAADRYWANVPQAGPSPTPRNGASLIYDAGADGLVLFGGDGGAPGFQRLGDLWRFDLKTKLWKQVTPSGALPTARWHSMMAVDNGSHHAFMFGGAGLGADRFDRALYDLDLSSDHWTRLPPGGVWPPSLQGSTMTYDSAHDLLVLTGGLRHERPGPGTSAEVWVFDRSVSQWSVLADDPQFQRRDHVAGYDPTTGNHYIVGGRVSQAVGNFYDQGPLVPSVVRLRITSVRPHN